MKKSLFIGCCILLIINANAQNGWTKKTPLPFSRIKAFAFSIDGFGYVGAGYNSSGSYHDLWKYDPSTDFWEQMESMPTHGKVGPICFALDGKGYVGGGDGEAGLVDYDFWQYDPQLDKWYRKADIPWISYYSESIVAFSIGNRGYFLAPFTNVNFFEYNPEIDKWTQKSIFPGTAALHQVGFSIETKAYVGIGSTAAGYLSDFWEYDQDKDRWTRKANFQGQGRAYSVGFSIHSSGYIGLGVSSGTFLNDFWEYHPSSDTWNQIADSGYVAHDAFAMTIGSCGYLGGGITGNMRDFWEYTPDLSAVVTLDQFPRGSLFPNPVKDRLYIDHNDSGPVNFSICTIHGQLVKSGQIDGSNISVSDLAEGVYFITLVNNDRTFSQKFIKQ